MHPVASRAVSTVSQVANKEEKGKKGRRFDAPWPDERCNMNSRSAQDFETALKFGDADFEENTQVLKTIALRGLRSFVICGAGIAVFMLATRRRKNAESNVSSPSSHSTASSDFQELDATERYLEEMRSLGFDVDTLEEELAQERAAERTRKAT